MWPELTHGTSLLLHMQRFAIAVALATGAAHAAEPGYERPSNHRFVGYEIAAPDAIWQSAGRSVSGDTDLIQLTQAEQAEPPGPPAESAASEQPATPYEPATPGESPAVGDPAGSAATLPVPPQVAIPPSSMSQPGQTLPQPGQGQAQPQSQPAPSRSRFSRNSMSSRSTMRLVRTPNMFGDFFGIPNSSLSIVGRADPPPFDSHVNSTGAGGAFVGRATIGDNSSPLPRDRVFLDYSYFDNVPIANGGVRVNRFVPGLESTFLDGDASIEFRLPMASTLNSDIVALAPSDQDNYELGDATIGLKFVLLETNQYVLAGGMMMSLPTADDVVIRDGAGLNLIRISNHAVHFMPYFGGIWSSSPDWFVQGFVQTDIQAGGNKTQITNGVTLDRAGTLNDATVLFTDIGFGYRMGEIESLNVVQTTPTIELHHTTTLEGTDLVTGGGFGVGSGANQIDTFNLVAGVTFLTRNSTQVGIAYVTPIGNSADQQFDGEVRLTVNLYPGQ